MDFKLRYLITADGKQAKAELGEVERSIERLSGRGRAGGSGFADVLGGNLAADAITKFSGLLADGGRAVLDYSAKLEQTKVAFNTLMGGAEAASKHIDELRKLSTSTPLEFQSLTKMSQRLQGAGIAAKDVTALIKDIGNTAAATGDLTADRMEGIGVAISQVFAKGKVSAEEMEQLAERGIPAWRILSQQLGLTIGETRKLAEQGKITSQQFLDAFQQFTRMNFGDAMEKQSRTFSGAMNVITNTAMIASETAFRPIFEKISTFAADVADSLQQQQSRVEGAAANFGLAVGEAIGRSMRGSFELSIEGMFNTLRRFTLMDIIPGILLGRSGVGTSINMGGTEYVLDPTTNTLVPKAGSTPGSTATAPRPTMPRLPGAGNAGRRNADAEAKRAAAEAARIAQRDLAARFGIEQINNRTIQDQFAKQIEALVGGFDVRDGSDSVFGAMTEAFKLYRENLEASLRELEKLEKEQLDVKATANEIALLEANQQQRRLELNDEWKKRRDDAIEDIQSKEKAAGEERFRIWQMDFEWQLKLYKQAEERLELERRRNEEEKQRVLDSIGPANANQPLTGDMIFGDAALGRIDEATGRVRNMSDVLGQLGAMAGDTFVAMGEGLGNMLGQWVLLGDQADMSMQKMVASILSGVAAQSATLAIFHTAMGIAALTPWGNVMYGPAAFQFKSAALWAGIAAGTAIGGRAIAGDSFQSGGASAAAAGGVGGSSASSGTLQPFSRASDQAFMSGRSDLSQAVSELSAEVRGLKQKLSGMRPGDVLVAGAREKRGFIGYQVARDIRTNANAGTVLLKNAGFRN